MAVYDLCLALPSFIFEILNT